MDRYSLARRLCFVVLLICVASLAGLLVQTINERGASTVIAKPNVAMPLAGTWRGDFGDYGVILDIRSDGSGRRRSLNDSTDKVEYFEWSVANGEFVVEMAAEPREYARRIRQSIFGATTVRYEMTNLSSAEFTLFDRDTGKTLLFTLTNDPLLEASP